MCDQNDDDAYTHVDPLTVVLSLTKEFVSYQSIAAPRLRYVFGFFLVVQGTSQVISGWGLVLFWGSDPFNTLIHLTHDNGPTGLLRGFHASNVADLHIGKPPQPAQGHVGQLECLLCKW